MKKRKTTGYLALFALSGLALVLLSGIGWLAGARVHGLQDHRESVTALVHKGSGDGNKGKNRPHDPVTEHLEVQQASATQEGNEPEITARDYSRMYIEGPKGLSSIYPQLPEVLYREHLDAAQAGDADSQYWVAKALHECVGVPDYAHIDVLRHQIHMDAALEQRLYANALYCQELFLWVPRESIRAEYEKWQGLALLGGSAMARARDWHEHWRDFSRDEAKALLTKALYAGDDAIFTLIAAYYQQHADALEIPASTAEIQGDAWDMIHCRRVAFCDEKIKTHELQNRLPAYQFEAVQQKVAELERLLEKREPIEL